MRRTHTTHAEGIPPGRTGPRLGCPIGEGRKRALHEGPHLMTIDDPTLAERTFTETHDRILHALVEQVHDMGLRLAELEAAAIDRTDPTQRQLAPPAVPARPAPVDRASPAADATIRRGEHPVTKARSTRAAGWQPARR